MADVPLEDVEQAPAGNFNDNASPAAQGSDLPPRKTKRISAEKVIVLSFRGLQLQRIAALQDRLIGLSTQQGNDSSHFDKIDETLGAYGEFFQR